MPWIRLDDQIALHPKFVTAGPIASWLWVCGLSYCARYLTDGFIPTAMLQRIGSVSVPAKYAEMLVTVGLWDEADGGYRIHDYHNYQPAKEEVERRRSNRRDAGRVGGQRSGETRRTKQGDEAKLKQDASPKTNPVPSRPVPEERVTQNVTLSPRGRPSIHQRQNARIQNNGDPMPLWDWQFTKFQDALRPKFGEDAYTETMAWVHKVGDELLASGHPINVSDPVKWWDARYQADWGGGVDDLAAFKALGKAAAS